MRDLDVVLDELAAVGQRIQGLKEEQEGAYAHRLALFQECRAHTPPVTYRRLGDVAGVGEEAVQAALDKSRGKRRRRAA